MLKDCTCPQSRGSRTDQPTWTATERLLRSVLLLKAAHFVLEPLQGPERAGSDGISRCAEHCTLEGKRSRAPSASLSVRLVTMPSAALHQCLPVPTCVNDALTGRSSLQKCINCGATDTPLWRRVERTETYRCNACGIYSTQHGKERYVGATLLYGPDAPSC